MAYEEGRQDTDLASQFREVMAGVATPVSVVTTIGTGQPFGTTVSAFASLSMTPPMIMVSLDHGSDLLQELRTSWAFGVNILASRQADLALTFARKGGAAKFKSISCDLHSGLPPLPRLEGWLSCGVR